MGLLIKFVAGVGQILIPWALTEYLAWKQKQTKENLSDEEIDKRFEAQKAAFAEVKDGKPATPEQKAKIRKAVREFIKA